MRYKPEYPIVDSNRVPREKIKLVPESKLSPIERAELDNLRRGVSYQLCISDTPQNREAINVKATYFQMVAYKEGWRFNPENYQVRFVHPRHFLLSEVGTQRRIYEFGHKNPQQNLSPEGRVGISINGDNCVRMEDEETDNLAKRLLKYVFG